MKLFSPMSVRGMELKNRIVMSPMCMYSCFSEDGLLTEWHHTHYASRALGGAGLIFTEATAVTAQGRISMTDLGIWDDAHVEGLTKLVNRIHLHGAKAGIQLNHAGRKAVVDGPIIAPSALSFNETMKIPEEMTSAQIHETQEAFILAAKRAIKAGFDCLELHAAHGYLINQFLSPLTNLRTDEYGGDASGRYRFLKEIISAVRAIWDGPLFIRISASDYHPDGLTIEDHVEIARKIKEQGADLIDCSSGGLVPAVINPYPGYQVPFAERIRRASGIATAAVGLITTGMQAEEIVSNERADLVFLARELLRDPFWPRTAAKELGVAPSSPKQYERAWL